MLIRNIVNLNYINSLDKEFLIKWREHLFKNLESKSFENYDALKILSKTRHNYFNRIFVGITTYNDKLRFNLYCRPLHNQIEGIGSIHRSPLFDFKIKPGETKIKNLSDFKYFLEVFNALNNINPALIEQVYEEFLYETGVSSRKEDYSPISLIKKQITNYSNSVFQNKNIEKI